MSNAIVEHSMFFENVIAFAANLQLLSGSYIMNMVFGPIGDIYRLFLKSYWATDFEQK